MITLLVSCAIFCKQTLPGGPGGVTSQSGVIGRCRAFCTFDTAGLIYLESYAPSAVDLRELVKTFQKGGRIGVYRQLSIAIQAEPHNLGARALRAEVAAAGGFAGDLKSTLSEELRPDSFGSWPTYYEMAMLSRDLQKGQSLETADRSLHSALNCLEQRGSGEAGQEGWPIRVAMIDRYLELGDIGRARRMVRELCSNNPQRSDFVYQDIKSSITGLTGTAEYDPKLKKWTYRAEPELRPDPNRAVRLGLRLLQSCPESPSVRYALGAAYFSLGDKAHAEKYLREFLKVAESNPRADARKKDAASMLTRLQKRV